MNNKKLQKINFENHRKKKIETSDYISIIENNKVRSGWTNGRSIDEINNDFGIFKKDWFKSKCEAEAYLIKIK